MGLIQVDPDQAQDWSKILIELNKHLRLIDIAAYCGRTEGWVVLLKAGDIREPGFTAGCRLMELYRDKVPQETQDTQVDE